MREVKRILLFGCILAAALVALPGMWSCSRGAPPVTPVSIGTTTSEVNSLILIAQARGFFKANGLDVATRTYSSGKAATDGLLNGEVDLAASSEYAFAGNVLDGRDLRLIGVINRSSVEYLVGRRDRGINSPSDLRGKRVGVPVGSRPEFALGRFLDSNGISASDLMLVNVSVDRSADVLLNGYVDAVATWQPYIGRITDILGQDTAAWSVQSGQPSYNGLVCTSGWTSAHAGLVEALLRALVQAESYVAGHPEDAKALVQRQLSYSATYLASVWPDYQFSVSLDQSLITAMEDESRWMIQHDLTKAKTVPDYLGYIYSDGLKAVSPGAVNLID